MRASFRASKETMSLTQAAVGAPAPSAEELRHGKKSSLAPTTAIPAAAAGESKEPSESKESKEESKEGASALGNSQRRTLRERMSTPRQRIASTTSSHKRTNKALSRTVEGGAAAAGGGNGGAAAAGKVPEERGQLPQLTRLIASLSCPR